MNVPKLRFKEFSDEYKYRNLSDISTLIKDGTHGTHENYENGIPLLSAKDINNNKINIPENCRKISVDDYNKIYKNYLLKKDDILLTIVGSIGRTALYKNEKVAFQRSVATIRIDDNNNSNYIRQYIESPMIINQLNNMTNSSAQGGVYLSSLSKLNFDIPRKEEQLKIANFLSLLDKKIELQSKKIEGLKLFKLRLFENLTCKIEECIKVKEIGTLKNGYAFKNSQYDDDGLYNILTISNVNGNMYINDIFKNHYSFLPKDIQNHQILKEKDILISMTGNVGRVSYNKGKNNLLNQRVGILEIKENVNKDFIFYMLNNKKFENAMIDCGQGAAQLNISKSDIENFSIPYPNNQSQTKISKILNIISKKIKIENDKLNHYINLKKGLMQNMFV